ncbi:wax ester/triacylglycerol synthase domain-containing protein [Mycobacterium tilburgii]|uniref:wax ester/triacylglycerol synthase domain-containing protein n=1 Tax=Mycobacterium tilburgii TaxID=44467 RepID=UPI0011841760|nr:wax ester/triacylglycerol synthase domain-containing protein [Mycobacterium tilburgii]
MTSLTTLDAGFLKAEDADPRVSMAIGGLAVIEGPAPDQSALMPRFAERIRACPRFAQRLRLRPFDLGAPQWVEDLDFDIDWHLRRVALPHPGDDRELFRLVADLMARRLDRNRPLWGIWVIEGFADVRWAMLTKIQHCMADGIAAAHMLAGLCDDRVGDSFARAISRPLKRQKDQKDCVKVNPLSVFSGLWNTSTALAAGAARAAVGATEIAVGLLRPSVSPLNGSIGDLRRYSGARVPLAEIEQVCRAFRRVFPVSPIAMQLRTAVAMLSYVDDLFIGILADYDVMADIDELNRGIEAAVARLAAISKRCKVRHARGPLAGSPGRCTGG